MSPLRTRFVEDMQLHGYSLGTKDRYAEAVCRLAKYYLKSPDLVTEEELRRYFLHLNLEKIKDRQIGEWRGVTRHEHTRGRSSGPLVCSAGEYAAG